MDIANYLSELLNQYNEVSVPGLGSFSRLRVNGYYSDAEGTFYPPHFQLSFDQHEKEDDLLINYIAEKKRISVTSAQYFTGKYISNLKQDITQNQTPVAFANLGRFYSIGGTIAFKAYENGENEAFFGLSPVKINKADKPELPQSETSHVSETVYVPHVPEAVQPETTEDIEPEYIVDEYEKHAGIGTENIIEEPVYIDDEPETEAAVNINHVTADAPVIHPENEPVKDENSFTINYGTQPDFVDANPNFVYEEPERNGGISTWIIILLVIFIIASAVLTVYKFNPGLLGIGSEPVHKVDTNMRVIKPALPVTANKDTPVTTAPQAISKPDSTLSKTATSIDTSAQPSFAIFIGSFKTESKSELEIKRYKNKGVDARLLTGPGTGPRKKIVVGNFATSAEAETERKKLIAAKKINSDSYTQQINISK